MRPDGLGVVGTLIQFSPVHSHVSGNTEPVDLPQCTVRPRTESYAIRTNNCPPGTPEEREIQLAPSHSHVSERPGAPPNRITRLRVESNPSVCELRASG